MTHAGNIPTAKVLCSGNVKSPRLSCLEYGQRRELGLWRLIRYRIYVVGGVAVDKTGSLEANDIEASSAVGIAYDWRTALGTCSKGGCARIPLADWPSRHHVGGHGGNTSASVSPDDTDSC